MISRERFLFCFASPYNFSHLISMTRSQFIWHFLKSEPDRNEPESMGLGDSPVLFPRPYL